MPRAATRTLRASRRTGSTAPASTAWSNASRALCWAPASMPQHRARAHAAHPGAAPARLQSGTLTTAQPPTSARSCTAQRSSSGASPCCRSFVQCSVRAAQRQADPWHARAAVGRRPAERVRAASAAMSPAAASERCKEAASRRDETRSRTEMNRAILLYQKEGYTTPSTLGCRRPTGRPPLPSPTCTCACACTCTCCEETHTCRGGHSCTPFGDIEKKRGLQHWARSRH